MYQYPYGDTQQLNLDWLMEQWQETKASIDGSLQGEIDRVEAAITDLLTARDQAVAAKTAAETAATSASGYASTASGAASTATAQATAAAASAALAGSKASDAQTAETNAALQATAAANSAAAAAVSKTNAGNSETAAAASSSAAAGNALFAEGVAKGTQNGTPVASGSPYYEDNAAYWAGEAQGHASNAVAAAYYSEAMAKGTVNGTPVASGDPGYEDNAEYYKDQAAAQAAAASAASADGTNAQKMIAAPEEASSTASAAHAAGTYFRYNNKLYKATQDIALGGTITPNTNCVEDTVCAELTAQSEQIEDIESELTGETETITLSKTYLSDNRYSTNRLYNADPTNVGKKFSDIYSAQTINAFACFVDVPFSKQVTFPIAVDNTYGYLAFDSDDVCVWVKRYPSNTGWTTGDTDTVILPKSAVKFLFVATNDLNNLGTDFSVVVKTDNVANNLAKTDAELEEAFSRIGNMYRGGFSVNANSTHSSSNDKIYVNIPANQTFTIGFDATAYGSSNLVMLYATKTDGTSANVANYYLGTTNKRIFDITATYDITALGAYYQNDSGVKVDVSIFISWDNAEIGLLQETYNQSVENSKNLGNIKRIDFSVSANGTHSSTRDKAAVSIPANKNYVIGLEVSSADSSSVAMFYATKADGSGTINVYNVYPKNKTAKFVELTATYDISEIGIYYSNTTSDTVSIHAIVSIDQIDVETLCDLENEYRFAEVAIDSKVQAFLSNYADTANSDTFAFFTDPHYLMNGGNITLAQINQIATEWLGKVRLKANAINAQSVICCGDVLNDTDTDAQACYKLAMNDATAKIMFGNKYHMALGNHDSKFDALDQDVIDNMLYAEEDTQKAYFSVKTPKTLYYYLNSGTDQQGAMDTYRWAQVAWLADKLGSGTDENRIVVIHIVSTAESADEFGNSIAPLASNIISLVEAYNTKGSVTLNGQTYNFSTATGKVRCILCGHTHYDKVYVTSNNLPIVCTRNTTSFGQVTSMNFDIGFLDYDNDKLYLYREGEGEDRTVTLA